MSNNEEQTQDEKLRAAAENMYNSFSVFSNKNAAPFNEYKRSAFIYGAKSEAAREYWQAQQKKVDVEALRKEFYDMMNGTQSHKSIFDFFIPHLQPESDAVEFGKWLLSHCSFTDSDDGPRQWFYYGQDIQMDTDKLYAEFKSQS